MAQLFDEEKQWFQIQFGCSIFHEQVDTVAKQTNDLSDKFFIQITAVAAPENVTGSINVQLLL